MGCKPIHKIRHIENFKDMLIQTEKLYGNRVAYKFKTNVPGEFDIITHKEFYSDIQAFGTGLINLGFKNKKVAVISENRYEWGVTYLAVTCIGSIIVPLDKSLPENEIKDLLIRSEAEAVVYSKKYDEIMSRIKTDVKLKFISMDTKENNDDILSQKQIIKKGRTLLSEGNTEFLDAKINHDEMGIMLFTSRNYFNI